MVKYSHLTTTRRKGRAWEKPSTSKLKGGDREGFFLVLVYVLWTWYYVYMELESGTILTKIDKDDYDLEVRASLGNTVAVKRLGVIHRSYVGVIAGLSLNPAILDVVEPLMWYVTSDLLKYYEVKRA